MPRTHGPHFVLGHARPAAVRRFAKTLIDYFAALFGRPLSRSDQTLTVRSRPDRDMLHRTKRATLRVVVAAEYERGETLGARLVRIHGAGRYAVAPALGAGLERRGPCT